ncbi:hypothetical protein LPTSP4_09160 [Leptospira ryugenii]|uniref:Uncharacterized protein n=1 Tax=Leptospira ryugenii TaxID=1917863 RepID=A0A2P2DXP9_9LEPT|nr:hypothetical protein [Leptospira ryugenii]GBF49403.1 hypothetical protein LPTSP4_09160 [Leptospira ryugenii]
MSFKTELMSGAKIGGAAFVGYALNRFLSTMDYAKQILKESPETGTVLVSSGISVAAIKFQGSVKDKLVRVGLVGGSIAASIHLATKIPTIQKALPAGIVDALSGEEDYEEMSGEELENQINQEVDSRIRKAFQDGKIQYVQPSNSQLSLAGNVNETPEFELDGDPDPIYSLAGTDSDIYSDIGK